MTASTLTAGLDLSWLEPDLAVGGALPEDPAAGLRDAGLGAVVDLRAETCDPAGALAAEIGFLHLPTRDHVAPSREALDAGVAFARRARAEGRRLLAHCQHGTGRAPTLALTILADRGWDPLEALAHAKALRPLVSPSPAQYEDWTAWLSLRRPEAAIPEFEAFKRVAYRHLGGGA